MKVVSVPDKLRGGDLRSIGRSNEIVADLEEDSPIIEKGEQNNDSILWTGLFQML